MIKKIVKIIKKLFNSIFNKKEIRLIEEKKITDGITDPLHDKDKINDIEESEMIVSLNNKQDFFTVYENVKNGVVKTEELMINDLIKVQLMMKNELDIIEEKINITEDEINSLNNQINIFKEDNRYYENLKNNN